MSRGGGSATAQELHDVFHCDDGTTLVAGSTESLAWLGEACVASDGDTVCDLTAADAPSPAEEGVSQEGAPPRAAWDRRK